MCSYEEFQCSKCVFIQVNYKSDSYSRTNGCLLNIGRTHRKHSPNHHMLFLFLWKDSFECMRFFASFPFWDPITRRNSKCQKFSKIRVNIIQIKIYTYKYSCFMSKIKGSYHSDTVNCYCITLAIESFRNRLQIEGLKICAYVTMVCGSPNLRTFSQTKKHQIMIDK